MPFVETVSFNRLFARCRSATRGVFAGNSAAHWSAYIMTDQTAKPWYSQLLPEVAEGTKAVALDPPTINNPTQGSQHAPGYVMLSGGCTQGAEVHILNENNSIWGKATVIGNKWQLLHSWVEGTWGIRGGQIKEGVPSYPSVERMFTVSKKSDAPSIVVPANDSRHRAGQLSIVVICDTAATAVHIQNHDGSQLGVAKKLLHGVWGYERTWDRGAKHVKAVATVNGKESSPSSMIQFFVE